MQLIIEDGILYAVTYRKLSTVEIVKPLSTTNYLLASGFRYVIANAVAYGALADIDKTILLAQLVKLVAK